MSPSLKSVAFFHITIAVRLAIFGIPLSIVGERCACAQRIEVPTRLPTGDTGSWYQLPLEDRVIINTLCDTDEETLAKLVASDAPIERSLAIFVLDCRGDVERLIQIRRMLNDNREGIPRTDVHMYPGEPGIPTTVAQHLRRAYSYWLGITPDDPAGLEDALLGEKTAARLVQPWLRRLSRAAAFESRSRANQRDPARAVEYPLPNTGLKVGDVKQAIQTLPPDIRWVVVATVKTEGIGFANRDFPDGDSVYSDGEAREIFRQCAVELGGRVDPDGSSAWSQPGMSGGGRKAAITALLRRITPDVLAAPAE